MSSSSTITVRVPLTIRRHGRRVVVGSDGERVGGRVRADPALVKALARAFRWKRMLDEGRHASVSDIAAAEKIDRGYVGSVLRLTSLAPDIVEAILSGRAGDLGLPKLIESFPLEWADQRSALQFGDRVPAEFLSAAT
jgi:hypothetical protein